MGVHKADSSQKSFSSNVNPKLPLSREMKSTEPEKMEKPGELLGSRFLGSWF